MSSESKFAKNYRRDVDDSQSFSIRLNSDYRASMWWQTPRVLMRSLRSCRLLPAHRSPTSTSLFPILRQDIRQNGEHDSLCRSSVCTSGARQPRGFCGSIDSWVDGAFCFQMNLDRALKHHIVSSPMELQNPSGQH